MMIAHLTVQGQAFFVEIETEHGKTFRQKAPEKEKPLDIRSALWYNPIIKLKEKGTKITMQNDRLPAEPDGVLLIDKPAGMTSHDVVGRVRRLFGTRQVGHTGTLDPMATGVLILLVGRAAKASEYVSHDEKSYDAILRLGLRTDTEDTTGRICSTTPADALPGDDELAAILPRFRGSIQQVPPMYSALKVGGRKLCDVARQGGSIERQPRAVEIRRLEASPASLPSDHCLSVTCSGGTYIRTLCADIGDALGCGGVMAALRRTEASGYPLSACYTLDQLAALEEGARAACLLPVETLFSSLPVLALPDFFARLCRNGCEVYLKKLGADGAYPTGTRLRLYDGAGHFFALGEVQDYPDGVAVKMIKLFVLGSG